MMKKILFVDDEKYILRALQRAFIDEDYDIFVAEDGESALDILKNNQIDLIISDMRMPKMDGYELLKIVKNKYPSVIRIILSGYADEDIIFKAIQTNIAKLYIYKPWDDETLKKIIKNVFYIEQLIKDKKLLEIINNIDYVPTLKNLYLNVLNLISDNEDISKIVKEIEKDPAISAKILQVANSAFYNLKTASIKNAIVYLGLVNIKNIILSQTFIEMLIDDSIEKKELWIHANLSNKLTSFIYEKILRKKMHDSYSCAGLLHGLGNLVLCKIYQKKYKEFNESLKNKSIDDILTKEKEYFGINHAEIGGALLAWWQLPLPIVETALFHHNPQDINIINKELVCIVNIACHYSWLILDNKNKTTDPTYSINYLKLDGEKLKIIEDLCIELQNELRL